MTPGFAKSRAELPYLYYPKADRVIINAHDFTPSGPDFSVNGKSPTAVWCPSYDDDGNGTTTLTDLVGTNDGTLVNFALTGSTSNWVADTDSGGVRALDFDAANDRVDLAASVSYSFPLSVSAWVKLYATVTHFQLLGHKTNLEGFFANYQGSFSRPIIFGDSANRFRYFDDSATTKNGIWHQIGFVVPDNDIRNTKYYLDGTEITSYSQTFGTTFSSFVLNCIGGSVKNTRMRLDDLRAFSATTLNSADMAHLSTGRGVQA